MKFKIVYIAFLIFLTGTSIFGYFASTENNVSIEERRYLTMFPKETKEGFSEWIKDFEKYSKDQFQFKKFSQRVYNTLLYSLKHESVKTIKYGKNGWIFNNNEQNINQYKGLKKYSIKGIQRTTSIIKKHQIYFEEDNNIPFIIFIAPDKHLIYPEYLPEYMNQYKGNYVNLNRIESSLNKSGISCLAIPNKILEQKNEYGLLYQKKAAHWNSKGAYIAYAHLIDHLKIRYPNLKKLNIEELQVYTTEIKQDFNSYIYGLTDETNFETEERWIAPYVEAKTKIFDKGKFTKIDSSKFDFRIFPEIYTTIIENPESDGPVVLLIRDSFSIEMLPFLKHSFSKIILVHHIFGQWDPNVILNENPEIVIFEIAQRNLNKIVTTPNFN